MLSIVIPSYNISGQIRQVTYDCIKSYREFADELIFCEDGGNFDATFMALSDTYIYNHHNVGYTANVNRGWKYAKGDFVAIVGTDTYLKEGNLKDLCIEGRVTSPEIVNQRIDGLSGSFFVVPKDCPKYLIETMKTYYSDEEYARRIGDIFTKVDTVKIYHHGAQTVTEAGVEGKMEADKEAYEHLPK